VSDLLRAMGREIRADMISQRASRDHRAERVDRELTVAVTGMRWETALNLVAQDVIAARIRAQMLVDLERDGNAPVKTALALTDLALAFSGFSPVGHDRASSASGAESCRGWLSLQDDETVELIRSGCHR
jgi:hypothetical protein